MLRVSLALRSIAGLAALACLPAMAADAPAMRIAYQSLQSQQSMYLSSNSRGVSSPRYRNSLSLSLWVVAPSGLDLARCDKVEIDNAQSIEGESLVPKSSNNNRNNARYLGDYARGDGSFTVPVQLAPALRPCSGLAALSGTLVFTVSAGDLQVAELRPVKDFLGKSAEIAGLSETVAVRRGGRRSGSGGQGEITIAASNAFFQRISQMTFHDAKGLVIEQSGYSGSSSGNDLMERTYRLDLPDDGAIAFRFRERQESLRVPFSLGRLDLSEPKTATGPQRTTIIPRKAE